ncbi:MAG: hypothetical protein ACFE0Q_06155 [Anaerolineae bacterium]
MPAPRIPERQPIGDTLSGVITAVEDTFLLCDDAPDGYSIKHEGTFTMRYGVVLLGKPHTSIVPALMALDYGAFKNGEDAWHFLMNKSTLYPRADVIGYDNHGQDAQVFVREVDLMYPLHLLIYRNETTTTPLCQIDAIITPNAGALPQRVQNYATIYPAIKDWKKANP